MPKETTEEMWSGILTGHLMGPLRHLLAAIPAHDRCKNCNAPFTGIGSVFMRAIGKGRYNRNPRFCNT